MRVEVYTEVLATKQHPAGGEMNDESKSPSWKLDDQINSPDSAIIASFLNGLANGIDPPQTGQNQYNNKQFITFHGTMKVVVHEDRRGEILLEIVSRKAAVIAAALRGTADRVSKTPQSIGTVLRGSDD